jgi:hypothetical protein
MEVHRDSGPATESQDGRGSPGQSGGNHQKISSSPEAHAGGRSFRDTLKSVVEELTWLADRKSSSQSPQAGSPPMNQEINFLLFFR